MKKFNKVYIEISNICNLKCSFCPEVERSKGYMDISLFTQIIEQLQPITEQVAFHLMGDPLMHPHFSEFAKICEERGVSIFLVTNGVLMREKQMDVMLSKAFRQVNFSLHSFPDNFKGKDPKPYLDRIFKFTDRAFLERPDLYINYRLWNLGEPKGQEEKNVQMLYAVQNHFGMELPEHIDVRVKKSIKLKNRLYLHFDTEFVWPSLALPVLGDKGTCYGLSSHFGILMDGTVVPCCLDKEGKIPLGNVREKSVQEILLDKRAQDILDGFQRRRLVEGLCQRCPYINRFKRS